MSFIINPYVFSGVTPDLEDDFSSDLWTNQEGSSTNVSGGVMNWDANSASTASESRDFGSTLDSQWVMRFKWTMDNVTQGGSGSNNELYVGISATAAGFSTTRDWIGMRVLVDSGQKSTRLSAGNNKSINSGAPDHNATHGTSITATTYYVKLRRTSDTEAKFSLYSDSGYTTEVGSTITMAISASTITGLRYIHVGTVDDGGDSTFDGSIDDLEIYNGTDDV